MTDSWSLPAPLATAEARMTEHYTFIPSRDLNSIIHVDYDFIPETSHLLMLEKPQECAALTLEFLENLEINP